MAASDCTGDVTGQTNRLFVGNLNRSTDADTLTAAVSALGEHAVSSRIVSNSRNGRSKGYGFVTFLSAASASEALNSSAHSPITLDGHTLELRHCALSARPSSLQDDDRALVGERVPCPFDNSHSVPFVRLKRHLLVCPSRPVQVPWSRAGVNAKALADHHADQLCSTSPTLLPEPSQVSDEELELLLIVLKQALIAIVGSEQVAEIPIDAPLPPSLAQFVHTAPKRRTNPEGFKHRRQHASILGHLDSMGAFGGQLSDWGATAFVDFGAGSGFLTGAIFAGFEQAASEATCFLVDRQSAPHRRYKGPSNSSCVRVQCDLADLWLNGLEVPKPCRCAGIGKHLCGAATDLALECFGGSNCSETAVQPAFLSLAPCCYHKCDWKLLAGRQLLATHGIDEAMFHTFTRLSSHDHSAPTEEELEAAAAEQDKEATIRQEVARLGIRLVLEARLSFLRARGWSAKLVRYVDSSVTPHNLLIVAHLPISKWVDQLA